MQLEAAMCPMTMYELGKSQKLTAEMKSQLDTANSMNAYLSSQKSSLESQLNVSVVNPPPPATTVNHTNSRQPLQLATPINYPQLYHPYNHTQHHSPQQTTPNTTAPKVPHLTPLSPTMPPQTTPSPTLLQLTTISSEILNYLLIEGHLFPTQSVSSTSL